MKFKLIELASNRKLDIDRDALYDLYINKQKTSKEIADIFGCSSKSVRNYLKRYNIPIRPMPDAVKLERSKWTDDKELQRSIRVHNAWASKTPEEIKSINDKKLASGNINSPSAIAKAHQTRIANGTTKESKSEEDFYHKLLIMGFNRDDVIRHYFTDARYPFNCDFYIPSRDMFIEYQGHQTHGCCPFDASNPEHQNILKRLLDRGFDMSTWTRRDPHKLQTALRNKITLILIYPKHDTYLVKDGKITTIDINDINKI